MHFLYPDLRIALIRLEGLSWYPSLTFGKVIGRCPSLMLRKCFCYPKGAVQVPITTMSHTTATFQRLVNHITSGLSNVVTYIDDDVVYSSMHLSKVKQLFLRLSESGSVSNLPKCKLGKGQMSSQGSALPRYDIPAPRT